MVLRILIFTALCWQLGTNLAMAQDTDLPWQSAASSLSNDQQALIAGPKPLANTTDNITGKVTTIGDFLPVEQAYQLNSEFQPNGDLRLNWQIAEGYFLYRHAFRFELLAAGQPVELTALIPDGLRKDDEYFGQVEVYYHSIDVILKDIPANPQLQLKVISQGCADTGLCYPPYSQYFQLDGQQHSISVIPPPAQQASTPTSGARAATDYQSLPFMLLLALVGGVILNLMPCVFPILSLKVLAFARDKEHSQVVHGTAYTAGVVLSFIAVAAILVSLQAAGKAIGWGFHLQSPWFVGALTYLFFVMGLSLSGFIEFGGQWMNAGDKLAAKPGYSGSFFTGVLATVVASPCTAPFMGTALGFAVTQPVPVALLVFAALGFGMALPVLLLSFSPRLLKKIPKPGPWMEQLKQLLAFPLYATAVWLAWVVGKQTGVNGMSLLLLGCVLLTLALWLWRGKTLGRTLAATCAALAIAVLGSSFLQTSTQPTANAINASAAPSWQAYSPETLATLRSAGKPVFINVTADWCITCLANESVSLSTQTVQRAFSDNNINYLKADWTNYDPQITELLRQHGRTGIPLYVMYPAGAGQPAAILPQFLTVNNLLEAIDRATTQQDLALQ